MIIEGIKFVLRTKYLIKQKFAYTEVESEDQAKLSDSDIEDIQEVKNENELLQLENKNDSI